MACGHERTGEINRLGSEDSSALAGGTPAPSQGSEKKAVSPFGGFSQNTRERDEGGKRPPESSGDDFLDDSDTAVEGQALGRCPQCGRVITGDNCLACSWVDGDPISISDESPVHSDSGANDDLDESQDTLRSYSLPQNALSDEELQHEHDAPRGASNENVLSPRSTARAAQPTQTHAPAAQSEKSKSVGTMEPPTNGAKKGPPRFMLFGVGVFAVALILAFSVKTLLSSGEGSSTSNARDALSTIAAVQEIEVSARTGQDWLSLGEAHMNLEQPAEALDAFGEAAKRKETNENMLLFSIRMLGEGLFADKAIRVLGDFAGTNVDEKLRETLSDENGFRRRQALKTLQMRGVATVSMRVKVNIKDLLTELSCESRKQALVELMKIAHGADAQSALDVINKIENDGVDQYTRCLLTMFSDARARFLKQL